MDFVIGSRVELIVLHVSPLHELLSKPIRTELNHIQLMTTTIEPPEHQSEPHKGQPDRLAAKAASNLKPVGFAIERKLTRPRFEWRGRAMGLCGWKGVCSKGLEASGRERRIRRSGEWGACGCWYRGLCSRGWRADAVLPWRTRERRQGEVEVGSLSKGRCS